jgi:hypothetical protein
MKENLTEMKVAYGCAIQIEGALHVLRSSGVYRHRNVAAGMSELLLHDTLLDILAMTLIRHTSFQNWN